MYGAVAKETVGAKLILPFKELAVCGKTRSDMPEPGHHDGWGVVAYFRKSFPEYLEREPHSVTLDADRFEKAAAVIEEFKSKVVMAHFRKISVGNPQISNTHPFLYKEWSFCHNGTIFDSDKIPLNKLKPGGATDSERFFLYIMEHLDIKDVERSIQKSIAEIKKDFKYTSLTFLLSDGESLYAYRDLDPQYQDYYTLHIVTIDHSHVICSEPLTKLSNQWKPLLNETFLAIKP